MSHTGPRPWLVVTLALLLLGAVAAGAVSARTDTPTSPSAETPLGEITSVTYDDTQLTVHGDTSLSAGATVQVRVRSSASSPFLISDEAEVASDGTFEASFDLSDPDPPGSTEVTVHVMSPDGDRIAEHSRVLSSLPATPTPEPTQHPTVTEVSPTTPAPGETQTPGQPGFGVLLACAALVVAGALSRVTG